MNSPNLIRRITENQASLRKSEAKVANYVLANASEVIKMRIVDLASRSEVSEPTVIRFCKAIGFDGFQSFKLQLAQQLGLGSVFTQFAVADNDTVADLINKVFDTTVGSLITAREEINSEVLEQAITTISNARRVEFYGFGASGSVAADAQHKFFRLQLSSAAYTDPHIQRMSAISLGPEDVVVAISQSGETQALLESVALAREAGANVIGLAPHNTSLSRVFNLAIYVNMEEDLNSFRRASR